MSPAWPRQATTSRGYGLRDAHKKLDRGSIVVLTAGLPYKYSAAPYEAAMIKETDPEIPVILLTGFGDMMLVKDERVGNVAVGKPITLARL